MIDGNDRPAPGPLDETGSTESWLLTPRQVSQLLSVSRSKVYELLAARSGGLKSIVIGRSRRIRRSDLLEWLAEQQAA